MLKAAAALVHPFCMGTRVSARWCGLLALLLTACAPGLDWRESRPEAGDWKALFPCRPVHQTGRLAFGDDTVAWQVSSCQAGEVTWSVGMGMMQDPQRVRPALRALRAQVEARFPAAQAELVPQTVPGMTPQPEAGRWRWSARNDEGQLLRVEQGLFAHGSNVLQVLLIGPALTPEAAQVFFDGLSFPP